MKFFKLNSYLWLIVAPLLALIKGVWLWMHNEFEEVDCLTEISRFLPNIICENIGLVNILLSIILIFIISNMLYSYNRAYIYLQENHFVSFLFSLTIVSVFTINSLIPLLIIGLSTYAMLQFFTLSEDSKIRAFFIFDIGLILGVSLLVDLNVLYLGLLLLIFLLLHFELSFRKILQYVAGVFLPIIFYIPYLYFTKQLPLLYDRLLNLFTINRVNLQIIDYVLIFILSLLSVLQAARLLSRETLKPKERSFIFLLLAYSLASLSFGIFRYSLDSSYVLFVLPSLYLFHSYAKLEKNYLLLISFLTVILYSLFR